MNKDRNSGQILIGALVVLTVLIMLIPMIIKYVESEGRWTVKEQHGTRVFELAESAVEQGYQQLLSSTTTWKNVQAGTAIAGFNFDAVYQGPSGGQYEIQLTSGPQSGQATVTGIAHDLSNEIRTVQAVYTLANTALYAMNGVMASGAAQIEWGSVMSPGTVDATGKTSPRFQSAGSVLGWDSDPTPPNTDNLHWWSFQTLPATPQIDLQAYKDNAFAIDGSQPLGSGPPGSIYYYSGDLDPGVDHFIDGTLIVLGSLTLHGHYGNGSVVAPVPPLAWMEYGTDAATWANFKATFDGGAPASFPGFSSNYQTVGKTTVINNLFLHGFLYVGNALSLKGGGTASIEGSVYSATTADLGGSPLTLYFDPTIAAGIKVKNNSLSRVSWQEISCSWTGVNPTCP